MITAKRLTVTFFLLLIPFFVTAVNVYSSVDECEFDSQCADDQYCYIEEGKEVGLCNKVSCVGSCKEIKNHQCVNRANGYDCGNCSTCSNGSCQYSCTGCQSCQSDSCVDNDSNCTGCKYCLGGACKNSCGNCESCFEGDCRYQCTSNEICIGGACLSPTPTPTPKYCIGARCNPTYCSNCDYAAGVVEIDYCTTANECPDPDYNTKVYDICRDPEVKCDSGWYCGSTSQCAGATDCNPNDTENCWTIAVEKSSYACGDGNCGSCQIRTQRVYCVGLGGCTEKGNTSFPCTHCGDTCIDCWDYNCNPTQVPNCSLTCGGGNPQPTIKPTNIPNTPPPSCGTLGDPVPSPVVCSYSNNKIETTLNWGAGDNANFYSVRVNAADDAAPPTYNLDDCNNMYPGDYCFDQNDNSPFTFIVTPDVGYDTWVHSRCRDDWQPPEGVHWPRFSCPAPSTAISPTPSPTPTPGPWTKLKNSSFYSQNSLNSLIPLNPVAYDADDDASANFIIGEGGLVAAPSINLTGLNSSAKPSANDWSVSPYSPVSRFQSPASFLSYVKARKEYKTIITDLNQINSDYSIYFYNADLTLTNADLTTAASSSFVLIVGGNLTINEDRFNIANDCLDTSSSKSIAFLATGTITFSDSSQCAAGIFIAPTIDTGSNPDQGMKIKGNLIAQTTLTNNREWSDVNKPVIYVVFEEKPYLELLPYLSTANYEWQQTQ